MKLFEVYPLFDIKPVKGEACYVFDEQGKKYLDFYGGHAVISIGHAHPRYVAAIQEQVANLSFYSNSIINPLQEELAEKLGELSGYEDHRLFLCNSGAEATENALKLASFHNGRRKVIAFCKAFHGRTSLAVAATDNPAILAPVNQTPFVQFIDLENIDVAEALISQGDVSSVIIEGIRGVGGIAMPSKEFLQKLSALCRQYNTVLILDEIQSGYGRSGCFFAHQYHDIQADIVTVAKGMGNGFPMGGLLIGSQFEAKYGMLGTTFGGNHLACAAGLAVLDVIEQEKLMANARMRGEELMIAIKSLPHVKEVVGKGLMIGVVFDFPVADLRRKLLFDEAVFTGAASDKNMLRLLPPLTIGDNEVVYFLSRFAKILKQL